MPVTAPLPVPATVAAPVTTSVPVTRPPVTVPSVTEPPATIASATERTATGGTRGITINPLHILAVIAAVLLAVANSWPYVAGAYVAVFGLVLAYAAWVIVRGRRVGRQLPPDERRWSK